ncbi:uroporphyrin-III C-methyltransferase [Caulobacter ginsengisoli]|uniref:uroporphyrinogen-III C-methyltransferase n=1 Tax=Caulobacter ginsengisoli TaxID=400775 RepID=A0ABU0ILP5_9CAUL|nr:uroporphyrinogen-III C-methyltransferase [Caulobacter ginsengisoli]MDQ0462889.1 uroporphyrin-III C-methyltransferase [Caulobacter ginsengisoli]
MPHSPAIGRVQLVGAGPGAADLLTVRALRAIEGAQAVLYDALVSAEIVALAPAACLKIRTGKRAGRASLKQETINRLMLRLARRGLKVVRLKGGDPSIFGRVGEEAAFLRAHGVETEIVPGVTAACAAAAQFGFPLTHRGEARRLVFATAMTREGLAPSDWAAAADPEATLALYMGRDQLGAVAGQLIAQGRAPSTPAMAVENAGRPEARAIPGVLGDLADRLAAQACDGPVVLIIGEVAARARLSALSPDSRPRLRSQIEAVPRLHIER